MFAAILSIITPVVICVLIGVIWARIGRPWDTAFVTRMVMNVGAPFLILSSFQKSTPSVAAIAEVGLAAATITALTAALAVGILKLLRADLRTFLPAIAFQNTGNMGLPLCLFAFGDVGLSLAVVVFMWVSVMNFTVGVAIASGETNLLRVARTPLVWATFLAIGLALAGITLPAWLRNTADILGGLTIPMMLIALGVSLSGIRVSAVARSAGFASLRFVLGGSLGWLIAEAFGLSGVARGVIVLQSAMPPAVFNYLIAARYQRNAEDVAGVVAIGTLMSIAVVPVVLWWLLS